MKKILVPCRMAQVATNAIIDLWDGKPSHWNPSTDKMTIAMAALEAALQWLSENPIVPSQTQAMELTGFTKYQDLELARARLALTRWQRRMFLAPEPEVHEEIEELLWKDDFSKSKGTIWVRSIDDGMTWNQAVIEAYKRGKASK